jgi:uncharacterized protein (DUF2225 family)
MRDENYVPEDLENGERAVSCPICGTTIINNPAQLLFDIDSIDTDFRIRTFQDDLLDEWLIQCPNCYFVSHDFSSHPVNLPEVTDYVEGETYLEQFSDNNPTTLDLFRAYLGILAVDQARSYLVADCYMRMSWLFDDEGDEKMAAFHRKMAVESYERALLEKDMSNKDISMTYYLISDMYRRNKDFEKARNNLYNLDTSITMMRKLFDFQWKLISEKISGIVHLLREEEPDETLS